MEPVTAAILLGGLGAASAAGKFGMGAKQKKAAKGIQAVAPEVGTQALDASKIMAGRSKVPGQDRTEEMLESKTADILKQGFTTGQPGAVSSYIAQAMSNLNKNMAQSQAQAAQYREGKEADYLSKLAGYEKDVFAKKQSDYERALAARSALESSASQNIMGGIDTLASTGTDFANLKSGTKYKTTED